MATIMIDCIYGCLLYTSHTFTISLGFAEYPVLADDRSQLMRCADMALYEVKMRGKNGCMAYREGERIKSRAKLGFAVKDIIDLSLIHI